MDFRRMIIVLCVVFTTPTAVFAAPPYPNKPVRLVVAYPPGGTTDLLARVLSASLSPVWGQQIVVDNRAGAAGMIGAEQVVRAAADGYTLLLGFTPEVSINKLLYKDMRYDPLIDLQAIVFLGSSPLLLASSPTVGISSFADLLKQKDRNASLSYGSPGFGAQQHLAGELLRFQTGVKLTHVPYKGTGLAVAALLGGHIDLLFAATPPLISHVRAGKINPLMVTDTQRDALLPNVPSANELGLQGFVLSSWFGVFGPKNMNRALVEKISSNVTAVLSDKAIVKKLAEEGLTVRFLPAQQFQAFIAVEMKKYGDIITKAGVQRQ
ncbi:MAG: tripartite tricarboxylate transporter substrate binding protein [Betaproteobacteria bacterium]|nr:tripartite tricarboxylate transporter substrate binding protein [Betaproteobacteria bacterium]